MLLRDPKPVTITQEQHSPTGRAEVTQLQHSKITLQQVKASKLVEGVLMYPKVSVIVPTYNRAELVCQTIDSVLAQTFSDLEVIVVDDESSDGTVQVLKETYGDRIRCFSQANQGVSVARNRGIEEARGEWIAFVDHDDLWEKEKLEWQFKALERFSPQCGGCYTDTRLYNHPETRSLFEMAEKSYRHEGTMGVNSDALRLLVRPGGAGMLICLSSFVGRADVIRKTGGFDPRLRVSQDSEFMFRMAMLTDFCYVNLPLARKDQSSTRHVGAGRDFEKTEFLLKDSQIRLEGLLRLSEGLPKNIRNLIREHLASVHSGWANWHLEAGEYAKARESISKAAHMDFTLNFAVKWLLTWISPPLALRTVRQRQERKKDAYPFM